MSEHKVGRDLTTGSILSNVLYMGIPSMIGFAAMTVYELTDMFWVARLGTSRVAAVTLFASFVWVLSSINALVGAGSVAVISRRFGERNYDGTALAIEQTLLLKLAIGIPVGIVGYAIIDDILRFMTSDLEVVSLGTRYGRIFFMGIPFMFASYSVYTALRGMGEAPKAMYIMLFSTGLNMALDPLLIVVLGMGIVGAAIATVISATAAIGVGVMVLSSKASAARIGTRGLRIDIDCMRRIVRIGFPPFIESIARSLAFWLIAMFVAHYGRVIVASYGICSRIVEVGIIFAVGLEMGASAIIGQSLGAGKVERASQTAKKAALLSLAIASVFSVVEIIFGNQIMHMFGKSEEVKAIGAQVLIYFAIGQPLIATAIGLSSAFYGSGKTWPPTIAALVASWAVQVPLSATFVYVLKSQATAMWIVMIASEALLLGMLLIFFKIGTWKRMEV